jgi:hypothetical protein
MLDEVADPGGCRWAVYKGPLWVDMDLPVRVDDSLEGALGKPADAIRFRGVTKLLEDGGSVPYRVSLGGGDTHGEMLDSVTGWAFPALHRVMSTTIDGPPERRKVAAALRRDVVELLRYA